MKIDINRIRQKGYAAFYKKEATSRNISIDQDVIKKSLENDELETRIHHTDASLKFEWDNAKNFDESHELQRQFHHKRIATLIKEDKYKDTIIVSRIGEGEYRLIDGGHRLHASKFMDETEVDAIVLRRDINAAEKKELLKKIECSMTIEVALTEMGIDYER